jgi:group I intron endonuclease
MKISGIYMIKSKIKPERFYIGSAVNIYDRWSKHLRDLKRNIHHCNFLQNHFNKYGVSDLEFSIIITLIDKHDLIPVEQYWIDKLQPTFNTFKIAASALGFKHPIRSDEFKELMRNLKLGKHLSEEHKNKIRKGNLGKVMSDEAKEKLRKFHLGLNHSEETKEKMRNRIVSDEGIENMRNAQLGKKHSEETKEKISNSLIKYYSNN